MKLYKFSAWSECGTYFRAYLKSVTICASSQSEALDLLGKWLDEKGQEFIRPPTCEVSDLSPGVVDYLEDSDY